MSMPVLALAAEAARATHDMALWKLDRCGMEIVPAPSGHDVLLSDAVDPNSGGPLAGGSCLHGNFAREIVA